MDCVYRNQCLEPRTGGCMGNMGSGQTDRTISRYPSGMAGYPLAMAYVPWQQWKTPYDAARGLGRGTIFQELDLPFMKERCSGV